ncbi:MAG: hypothetical protein ACTHQQ_22580 [Solirubrobacteraceae bacterium]
MATSEHHRRANKQSEPRRPSEQAPPDPLRQLGERLDRASLQARRVVVEAAEAALRGPPVPPASGWAAPGGQDDPGSPAGQLESLVAALASLRDLVPPELQRSLAEAMRELLIAVRSLLDWYIERLDHEQTASSEPEDIPIL